MSCGHPSEAHPFLNRTRGEVDWGRGGIRGEVEEGLEGEEGGEDEV